MRILYLTTESYSKDPIIESQVVRLLNSIASVDHQFNLIVFDSFSDLNKENIFIKNQFFKVIILKKRIHFINILYLIFYVFTKRNEFDIVHCRSYPPMFAGVFAKLFLNKKLIFDPRGVFSHELSYFEKRYILSAFFKFCEKWFCYFSNRIVLVSNKFKEYVLSEYDVDEGKMIVIPTFSNKIEPSSNTLFSLKKDVFSDDDILLFAYSGSPEKWQMIDSVFKFFKITSSIIPKARFIIFSKSTEEFHKLIIENSMEPEIIKTISLKPDQLNFHLFQCDFGVLFRENHIINRVSSPIKVRDYLLSGLPVIISDNIGDTSDFVRDNNFGFILNDLDHESMTSVLDQILSESVIFDKTKIAESVVSSFGLNVISEKYISLYNNL